MMELYCLLVYCRENGERLNERDEMISVLSPIGGRDEGCHYVQPIGLSSANIPATEE